MKFKILVIFLIYRSFTGNDEAPLCFIPIDHPTCSRQHAVIQFRLVGDVTKPYLLDLGGKNGTFVNEKRVPAAKYYELREGDLIKFAHSSKSYVLLSAGPLKSKEDKKETDEDGEIDFDVLEDSPQLETSRGTMLGYADDKYEYRHVILPKRIAKDMFRIFQAEAQMRGRPTAEPRLLTESEWRGLGVQQSRGWMHYENHRSALALYGFSRGKAGYGVATVIASIVIVHWPPLTRMGSQEGAHKSLLNAIPVKTCFTSHALVISKADRSGS
ncbi:Cyclin-dependent kinases regulatory subunit 2 [Perkinsus olseni]|uniref:Cyclin-dependent kinases regulatory subunit n=1 Tax=Perkinsus olseni TaxID=32597 RepID=A0A7J6T5H2_PEROL|nr:Cyclin-dependent kinases regulatory subunit 2 [Perkinsus olseni]KAF4750425.1 Cyclin-dependent kinases regulatory subunit 2 [Perkinsus olseni]